MTVLKWLENRIKRAFESWVERLIFAAGLAALYAAWRLREYSLTVPVWLAALVVAPLFAMLVVQTLGLRRRRTEMAQLEMTAAYAGHLREILYALQRVLSGAVAGVTVSEFLEDGILQPARDLLRSRQEGEDVRLSILTPEGRDFVMPFAAGHNLASKRAFRMEIEASFSKWAYRNNRIYWSGDLAGDDRFTRHPRAAQERGYNSIISVPIRIGDDVVAVFNTIFTRTDAFDDSDLIYVRLIGAVVELVWQLTGGHVPDGA